MNSRVRHIVDAVALRAMPSLRAICACLCAAMCCLPLLVMGQPSPEGPEAIAGVREVKDSIRIYFRGGKSVFDPGLRDNRAVLSDYVDRIRMLDSAGRLIDIVVEGHASPDGTARINERLSAERTRVLASMIERQAGIDPSRIKTKPGGIDWAELRRMVEANPDVPAREAVLDIIDNTPVFVYNSRGHIIGGRKKSLMDLRGGRPYRWMYANLFPEMRNAVSISLSYAELPATDSIPEPAEAPADTVSLPAPPIIVVEADTLTILPEPPVSMPEQAETPAVAMYEPLHAFALKTNLLYYPALLPNLELEWYVNDRWSVTVEGNLAWWGKYSRNRSYRLVMVSPEVRRWFRRGPLRRGLFVGATAGFGHYDLLKDRPGHRGSGLMAGITCGYQWPISRNLSLEAMVGAGYMHTNVKDYEPIEGHHVYQRTKTINYFGPIKLELSIAWRFLDIKSHPSIFGR